jgi:hypothetical protein
VHRQRLLTFWQCSASPNSMRVTILTSPSLVFCTPRGTPCSTGPVPKPFASSSSSFLICSRTPYARQEQLPTLVCAEFLALACFQIGKALKRFPSSMPTEGMGGGAHSMRSGSGKLWEGWHVYGLRCLRPPAKSCRWPGVPCVPHLDAALGLALNKFDLLAARPNHQLHLQEHKGLPLIKKNAIRSSPISTAFARNTRCCAGSDCFAVVSAMNRGLQSNVQQEGPPCAPGSAAPGRASPHRSPRPESCLAWECSPACPPVAACITRMPNC